MSQQAAQADQQAAAYWRSVAQVDRQDASHADRQAANLTADARDEASQARRAQRASA